MIESVKTIVGRTVEHITGTTEERVAHLHPGPGGVADLPQNRPGAFRHLPRAGPPGGSSGRLVKAQAATAAGDMGVEGANEASLNSATP